MEGSTLDNKQSRECIQKATFSFLICKTMAELFTIGSKWVTKQSRYLVLTLQITLRSNQTLMFAQNI
jgi:hypothetical protein